MTPTADKKKAPPKKVQRAGCPLQKKCGGCQMQYMSYPEQLEWKQHLEERLLGSFGKVQPIIGMKNPTHYRNKVQAAFALTRQGNVISGVYQSGSHRIVPVSDCMIEDKRADEIINSIRKMLPQFKILPYNEDSRKGILRHVLVRRGFQSGQIMVVLVTAGAMFPNRNHFVRVLMEKHPEITTVLQNINPYHTNLVLGDREIVLHGPGWIEDTLCGCVFRISARSFYQINPVQTEILYQKAIDAAELTGEETVMDAYCGIGTVGLIAAKKAKTVIGVETNAEAVRDAKINCKRNQIENAQFFEGDAGEFMSAMADEGEQLDVVFMDPPRAGSDEKFLSSVIKLAPRRVVYISCNPETMARDLRFLKAGGYRVESIQPVDQFPYTHHVETVVLMSRTER